MTKLAFLLRNLRYFRGVNIAVMLGMAVATAVLTGALMVGDSVRESLADLALRRLGSVDYALISTRFFDQSLADRLNNAKGMGARPAVIVPAMILQGSAESGDSHTADVQIAALGAPGLGMGQPSIGGRDLLLPPGTTIVNHELATALGLSQPGASIVFSVPAQSDTPRESALARRGRNDVLNQLSANISLIENQGNFISLFNPNGSQRDSRNAWLNLKDLQDATEQPRRVNALLGIAPEASTDVQSLNDRLRKVIGLNDYGLSMMPVEDNESSVFARETYIHPAVIDAATHAADALHIPLRKVSVNLVNDVVNLSADPAQPKVIHYAVAAGISFLDEGKLAENEIAINQWAADQLAAKVGDQLRIDFYMRQAGGTLTDASKALTSQQLTFTIKQILPMIGLGADPKLPPNYKGLTDAKSVADWDPPEGLTINKKLVTKEDEKYWDHYRAAPKMFLSFDTARKLWGGVYGDVTGLRVPTADAGRFSAQLLSDIDPAKMGMVFRPIKQEQLAAARGGTDFGEFFLMFSFFLIVAAVLLVAMLFRLNVEQRARQLGLLSAVGMPPGALRRMSLSEGMILAIIGSAIGLAGAIGYTSLILLGLRTWWIGAVGTTSMTLHIVPLTFVCGWVGGLFVAFFAILWAVWRIGKAQPARLLAGGWGFDIRRRGGGRWARWTGIGAIIIGAALVAVALAGKTSAVAGFGGGSILLCGALAWLGADLRARRHAGASFAGPASLIRLGIRNATRHTARGVLSVGLIAFAAFTLITVAALKEQGVKNPDDRTSGTGGYRLILTAGIPLSADLNTEEGRKLDGMTAAEAHDPIYANAHFTMLRMWAGQDISCLNLTKPNSPTILGLPPEMIRRGGFVSTGDNDNWMRLDGEVDGQTPIIVDGDTAEYVLKMSGGDIFPLTDQLGVARQLRLVDTISHSIFQGQMLMSDANFRKLFPAQNGFGLVLVDPKDNTTWPPGKDLEIARHLSSALSNYSVSVDTTSSRLQTYQNVQNTYLETFQTLGALGLMLGTLGLAVVLVRTVIERRAELALLASLGFASTARVTLVLAENAFLLILGLALGTISAVIGILPTVIHDARPINVPTLALTLAIVLVIGLLSSTLAVALSGVHVAPADLRRE